MKINELVTVKIEAENQKENAEIRMKERPKNN